METKNEFKKVILKNIARDFNFSGLTSEDIQIFIENSQKFSDLLFDHIKERKCDVVPRKTSHLELDRVIETVDSMAKVHSYTQIDSGTYEDIFTPFSEGIDLKVFESHTEIKDFFQKNSEIFQSKKKEYHFLFRSKESNKCLVAHVFFSFGDEEMGVIVDDFECTSPWSNGLKDLFGIILNNTKKDN